MEKNNIIDKNDFYHLLAQEAGFTIADTKEFWRAVERIFINCALNGKVLTLGGFGKLYVKDIPAHETYDPVRKERYWRKPSKRVVLSLSSNFKRLLSEKAEEKDQ